MLFSNGVKGYHADYVSCKITTLMMFYDTPIQGLSTIIKKAPETLLILPISGIHRKWKKSNWLVKKIRKKRTQHWLFKKNQNPGLVYCFHVTFTFNFVSNSWYQSQNTNEFVTHQTKPNLLTLIWHYERDMLLW